MACGFGFLPRDADLAVGDAAGVHHYACPVKLQALHRNRVLYFQKSLTLLGPKVRSRGSEVMAAFTYRCNYLLSNSLKYRY